MSLERFILVAMVLLSIGSFFYIPKHQRRKAFLAALAYQTVAWITSIFLAQLGIAEYPVREFTRASRVVFLPHFTLYPVLFMWFMLLYPAKSRFLSRLLHWFFFMSIGTWFAYFLVKYTNITTIHVSFPPLLLIYGIAGVQYLICFLYMKWLYEGEVGKHVS